MANTRYLLVAALVALCASGAASQGLLDSIKETAGSAVDAVKGVASTAVDRAQQAAGAAKDAAGGLVDRATGALGMGDEAPADSVVGVASTSPNTTTLFAALQAAGLDQGELADPSFNATVFAPTDAAFEAALASLGLTPAEVLADEALLTRVLSYHVVPGAALMAADLTDGAVVQTMVEGPDGVLAVDLSDPAAPALITTSGQTVPIIATDIPAGNSVVHLIDGVLLPAGNATEAEPPAMEDAGADGGMEDAGADGAMEADADGDAGMAADADGDMEAGGMEAGATTGSQ